MKISGFNNVFRLPGLGSIANKKNEGDGGSGSNQYDPNQTRRDGKQGQEHSQEHSQEDPQQLRRERKTDKSERQQLDDAVISFHDDSSTQASGLNAAIDESGPGLRVVVKDVNGTTLRRFSGEDFLKLREGVSKDVRMRGKILDQKL